MRSLFLQKRKWIVLTAFLLALLLLLSACSPKEPVPDASGSEELTNEQDAGKTEVPSEKAPSDETGAPTETTPSGEASEVTDPAPGQDIFDYTPGEVSCQLLFDPGADREALSVKQQETLKEYFRLRGEELTDPLNSTNALYESPVRLSSELTELYEDRSASCLAALYRIQADYGKVQITVSIEAVTEKDGELFVTLNERSDISYRYKGHSALDRMSWSVPHTVVLTEKDESFIQMDHYDEELILPADEKEKEEALVKAYEAYLSSHPVTEEMRSEAREQILRYLETRIRTAIETKTYGMEVFKTEEIPELLTGAKITYDPDLSEKWVLTGVREQSYRLPFRQYKAVFSVTFDFTCMNPATQKTMQPFAPRYYRVFFLLENGAWEYLDIHDHYHFD